MLKPPSIQRRDSCLAATWRSRMQVVQEANPSGSLNGRSIHGPLPAVIIRTRRQRKSRPRTEYRTAADQNPERIPGCFQGHPISKLASGKDRMPLITNAAAATLLGMMN